MRSQLYFDVIDLYARYSAALDSANWHAWPEFFVDDCTYKVQPRENFEQNLPLATMDFESKGMLQDRVYGIQETLFYDPYYQRHIVDMPLIRKIDGDIVVAEANYAVLRTKRDQASDVYNTGRYYDRIQRTPEGLRFTSRICVYDSEMIPNSIIYPI